jgi:hypothetical protein
MTTFAIAQPLSTHFREAACREVECEPFKHGWETFIDERTPLGVQQAGYIRARSGRTCYEHRNEHGVTVFRFPPGQECFQRPHQVPLERPALYVVRGGDWRGNPRRVPTIRHTRPEDWRDHFAEHQDTLATRMQQG